MIGKTEVVLSKDTLDILDNLQKINQSIVLPEGSDMRVKNEADTSFATVTIDEKFPQRFNVYDMREFLTVLRGIGNPVLEFDTSKNYVTIKGDAGVKVRYFDASADLIRSYPEKAFVIDDFDVEFDVTSEQLTTAITLSTKLNLPMFGFKSDGTKIIVYGFSSNDGSNDESNTCNIDIEDRDTDEFDIFLDTSRIRLIDGDYTVGICCNDSLKLIRFSHKTLNLSYYMALSPESSLG